MKAKKQLSTPYRLQAMTRTDGVPADGMMISDFLKCDYMGAAEYEFGDVPKAIRAVADRQGQLKIFEVDLSGVTPAKPWKDGESVFEKVRGVKPTTYRCSRGRWTITKGDGGWLLSDAASGRSDQTVHPTATAAKAAAAAENALWKPVTTVFLIAAKSEVDTYSDWVRALAGEVGKGPRIKMGCRLRDWVNGEAREGDRPRPPSAWLDLDNNVLITIHRETAEALLSALPHSLAYMNDAAEARKKVGAS